MEHIKQLKKIRADAIARIRSGDDFKLAGKLGLLIVELGDSVDDTIDYGQSYNTTTTAVSRGKASALDLPPVPSEPHPFEEAFAKNGDGEQGEHYESTAELDAFAAKFTKPNGGVEKTGSPFLKTDNANGSHTNGAAH